MPGNSFEARRNVIVTNGDKSLILANPKSLQKIETLNRTISIQILQNNSNAVLFSTQK